MQDSRYHRDLEAEVPGGSIAGWQVVQPAAQS
jgi:hypothetical protein